MKFVNLHTCLLMLVYAAQTSALCAAGSYMGPCVDLVFDAGYGDCSTYYNVFNNLFCVGDGACASCCACSNMCESHTGNCTACNTDTYKDVVGDQACTACPAGTTSAVGATVCIPLVLTPCDPGYTGPDGYCTACAPATYKVSTGSAACTVCPANSDAPSASVAFTACTCKAEYTADTFTT